MRTPACSRLWVRRVIETFAFDDGIGEQRGALEERGGGAVGEGDHLLLRLGDDRLRLVERLLHIADRLVDVAERAPGGGERAARRGQPVLRLGEVLARRRDGLRCLVERVEGVVLAFSSRSSVESPTSLRAVRRGECHLLLESGGDLLVEFGSADVGDLGRDRPGLLVDVVLQRRLGEVTAGDADQVLAERARG